MNISEHVTKFVNDYTTELFFCGPSVEPSEVDRLFSGSVHKNIPSHPGPTGIVLHKTHFHLRVIYVIYKLKFYIGKTFPNLRINFYFRNNDRCRLSGKESNLDYISRRPHLVLNHSQTLSYRTNVFQLTIWFKFRNDQGFFRLWPLRQGLRAG